MKIKYVGQPGEEAPRKGVTAFGIDFPLGKGVEVKDDKIAAKLAGNNHFEEVKARGKAKEDGPTE